MENLLKDKAKDVAIKLAKEMTQRAQQAIPDLSLAKKITKPRMKEKYENAVNSCKDAINEQLNSSIAEGTQIVEDFRADMNSLGTALGSLMVGTAQFASRIAMIPPAIISATPMGPGISANMVPPMLQDLKAEGDLLSKTYDDTFIYRNRLRLDMMADSVPDLDSILSIHDSTASVVKPLITLVGASCDGEASNLPEVTPPLSYDYKASECASWTYDGTLSENEKLEDIERTAYNCSRFSAIFEADGVNCNNCKNYR